MCLPYLMYLLHWTFILFQCLFQILPGVTVIIVNPETKGPLGDSHLGEVGALWMTFLIGEVAEV